MSLLSLGHTCFAYSCDSWGEMMHTAGYILTAKPGQGRDPRVPVPGCHISWSKI